MEKESYLCTLNPVYFTHGLLGSFQKWTAKLPLKHTEKRVGH